MTDPHTLHLPVCASSSTLIKMPQRSRAREVALQLLFQRDLNSDVSRSEIERFVRDRLRGERLQSFCLELFDGVVSRQVEIDDCITKAAENWRLPRMPAVDRNVLRLGIFESIHYSDTPLAVAFDEAIELAKRYGSADSPSFVNGVLDQVRKVQTGKLEEG